jgi:nucleoid DNA-binding protein
MVQIYNDIATDTQLSRGHVKKVLDSLCKLSLASLQKGDRFVIPNIGTIKLYTKPALPQRVRNCFGKQVTIPARVATSTVRIVPIKKYKDMFAEKKP